MAEENPGHGRTKEREGNDGHRTDAAHEEQQAGQQRLELAVPVAAGKRGELRQQRRLDRLKEKDRDVGHDPAHLELPRGLLLSRRGQQLHRDCPDAEQELGEH